MFKYLSPFKLLIIKRFIISNLFVATLILGGLALSTLGSRFSFVWFAHGVALGLIFLRGKRILPGIFLGSFLAFYLAQTGIVLAVLLAFLLSLQVYLLYWIAERNGSPIPYLYESKNFIKFILYLILLTAINSLLMVILCYPILYQPLLSMNELLINWWLANFNGSLIFYLLLISCDVYFPQSDLISKKTKLVFIFHCLLLTGIIFLLAMIQLLIINIILLILIIMYELIVFYKYKQFGLISGLFIINFCLSLTILANMPIWQTYFAIQTLFYLQLIFTIINLYCVSLCLHMVKTEFDHLS